ncbi:hypothetical protein L4C54_11655 [Vibrio lamellibrachiae]|uniref:hypothetical protein n=1 Tax=Vibrio lamellibrachiae TaxID=2910253 RepID=UPI003D10C18B
MRQRITVQQLHSPIADSDLLTANELVEQGIAKLNELPDKWVEFCQEKADTAVESVTFLLKQLRIKHELGFPSQSCAYITLIENKLSKFKDVFIAYYKLAPGLLYSLKNTSPETYVWLMLDKAFSNDRTLLLSALNEVSKLDNELATLLVSGSYHQHLDTVLAELIEGNSSIKQQCFDWLTLRQSVSNSLLKHWYQSKTFSDVVLLPQFILAGNLENRDLLEDLVVGDELLFERLLGRDDRNTWFRKTLGPSLQGLTSDNARTFANLLEINELSAFNVNSILAPVQLALGGNVHDVEAAIPHMLHLEDDEGEPWLYALYIIYGDALPVMPSQLGIGYEWEDVLNSLAEWFNEGRHLFNKPSRLGRPISSESTLDVMLNNSIPAEFRLWMWRSLCLRSRSYFPWNPYMSAHQQQTLFNKYKSNHMAVKRFNTGVDNAIVGY